MCVCVQLQSLQEEQQELEQTVQQYDEELCAAAEDLLQLQREVAYAKAHAENLHLRVTPLQDLFEEIIQVTVQSPSSFSPCIYLGPVQPKCFVIFLIL